MSSRSLPRPGGPRGRRALVASGLAVALATVPGLARADEPVGPSDPLQPVTDLLDGGTGGPGTPPALPGLPAGDDADPAADGEEQQPEVVPVPAVEVPAELEAALQQLGAALQLPESCVAGIVESVELVVAGLVAVPVQLVEVVTELGTALEGLAGGGGLEGLLGLGEGLQGAFDPAVLADSSVVEGLQLLAETLPTCVPAPPAEEEPPEPPHVPAPAAAAPVEHPVAQPVAYPGYAPTAGDAEDDGVPPALAGLVLALAAGAGSAGWLRSRRAADPGA
ncbi:hypothetical protein SAMN04515665_102139 [Blastococcus sp. DSM 46786]|uniref:hypothetical protein n=1 Tax=Blastococcus sp. DSM 46786 TaxID=1798227 RepID=UPI0008B2DB53|nr:hypothetical protein [Blastococcus sp. DSM 46786]SEK42826.1 hypothetical protein SAMN04515665_102139 [Blastococcus sp. DSM 46786]